MSGIEKALNSDDLIDIGEDHHKAGRLQEAEAHYRRALEIDPGHPGALYLLANIAYNDGRLPFATQLTEELLRDEPNDAEAWHLLGMIALKKDNLARASEHFNKALAIQPAYAQAHYSLGTARSKQGDMEAALAYFQQALALNPAFAEAYYSIGTILQTQKKIEDAIALYRKAIAANAGSALVHVGLGAAHLFKNQTADATICFERAISLDPRNFLVHSHIANAWLNQDKINEAVPFLQQAITLNPQDTRSLEILAKTFYCLREFDKATEIYQQWLAIEPDNPVARHHLAAGTHEAAPARAEDAYVEHTFDDFAETFDAKLGTLGYRGPQLLTEALQRQCGAARKQFFILDAGCGTGLCGPLLTPYSAQLTGVDLSAGMMAKAKLRNVYDELVKAELTAYMQSKPNTFDIILSCDTLNYFGALEDVLAAARAAIRDGGHLFFTLEEPDSDDAGGESGPGYHLNLHGRYSHSKCYLQRTLGNAGFTIAALETAIQRYEGGSPVPCFVVSCRAV